METLKQLLIEHEKEQEVVVADVIARGFLSYFSLRLGWCFCTETRDLKLCIGWMPRGVKGDIANLRPPS